MCVVELDADPASCQGDRLQVQEVNRIVSISMSRPGARCAGPLVHGPKNPSRECFAENMYAEKHARDDLIESE